MTFKKAYISVLIISHTFFLFGQSDEIQNLVKEGISLHDEGEYAKAIEIYQKALKMDPSSSLANYEIAYSYLASGDYKNAVNYSKKVIEHDQGYQMAAYVCYGNALDMLGKPGKAIKSYEKAMESYDHYLIYYNHALTCFNNGKNEKAYNSVLMAIDNNPTHASSHLVLSHLMAEGGVRIKAMLPLYFFLLIEPDSQRAVVEYQSLRAYIDHGISKSGDNDIHVSIPTNDESEFSAAEMMISLSRATNFTEENKDLTELQLFAKTNQNIFSILGELKKDNDGFWWDFYVPYFYEIASKNHTEAYSYFISQSQGEDVLEWINNNPKKMDKFIDWVNQ